MPALLKTFSRNYADGSIQIQTFPLDKVVSINMEIGPPAEIEEIEEQTTDIGDEEEQKKEDSKKDAEEEGGRWVDDYSSAKLSITTVDNSSIEIDLHEEECNFEVRDEDGEIMCQTDSLQDLDISITIAMMDGSTKRAAALKEKNRK